MSAKGNRLGNLLDTPAPPAEEEDSFAAHQAAKKANPAPASRLWVATDTRTYKELARVEAATEKKAIARVHEETGIRGGFDISELDPATGQPLRPMSLAERGTPTVLPRRRQKRIPKEKLTVQVATAVLDALTDLVERDGTLRYDEVEAALRTHLNAKGIKIEED